MNHRRLICGEGGKRTCPGCHGTVGVIFGKARHPLAALAASKASTASHPPSCVGWKGFSFWEARFRRSIGFGSDRLRGGWNAGGFSRPAGTHGFTASRFLVPGPAVIARKTFSPRAALPAKASARFRMGPDGSLATARRAMVAWGRRGFRPRAGLPACVSESRSRTSPPRPCGWFWVGRLRFFRSGECYGLQSATMAGRGKGARPEFAPCG